MSCRIFSPALLALLLGCDASSITGRPLDEGDPQASLAAFDEHVRPALSLCAACHGKVQAPLFMVEDTATAHDAALSNVNFDDIDNSRFLERILKDTHNCGDCPETGEKVRAALIKWQEARPSAGNDDDLGTVTQQLNLPSNPQERQYDIGKFISDEYSGGSIMLSVRVEPDNDNKRYNLVNLKIITDKIDVYVRGLKPLINGKWNSKYAAYKDIDCAVKSNAKHPEGHIIHATGTSIVPDDFADDNKLSFSIAEIRLGKEDDPSCWSDDIHKDIFTHSIRPIIAKNCENAGCHGSERPGPGGDILSIYKAVMDKKMTIGAVLAGENANHKDRLSELDEDDTRQFLDWLNE